MYDCIDVMWHDLLTKLLANKRHTLRSRDGDVCGELIGWKGELDASKQRTLLTNRVRSVPPSYAAAETLWYLSGDPEIAMLLRYAPHLDRYIDGPIAYGAYGPRIFYYPEQGAPEHSLQAAISMLKEQDPASRQCVVSLWCPEDLFAARKKQNDIPCTLTWQFLQRDKRLHMIVTMRSNDAWLGFPLDLFCFTAFQRIVAAHLDVEVGEYHHQVGSMHLYSRFEQRAKDAMREKPWIRRPEGHGWQLDDTLDSCRVAVELERELRVCGKFDSLRVNVPGSMGRDLFVCCARKLRPELFGNADIVSPRMRSNPCS